MSEALTASMWGKKFKDKLTPDNALIIKSTENEDEIYLLFKGFTDKGNEGIAMLCKSDYGPSVYPEKLCLYTFVELLDKIEDAYAKYGFEVEDV